MHRRLAGRIVGRAAGALAAAAMVAAATLTAPAVQAAPVQAAPVDAVVPQSAVAIEAATQAAGCATTGYSDLIFTGSVSGNPTVTAKVRSHWVQCPSGKRIQSLTISGSSNLEGLMRSNNFGNPSVYYWNGGTLVNGFDALQYIDVPKVVTLGNQYATRVTFDGWTDITSGVGPVFNVARNL